MQYEEMTAVLIDRVLMNREDTGIPIQNYAIRQTNNIDMSNYLADTYYTAINNALDVLERDYDVDLGRQLITELCLGLGSRVFDLIAADVLEEYKEEDEDE